MENQPAVTGRYVPRVTMPTDGIIVDLGDVQALPSIHRQLKNWNHYQTEATLIS